MKKQIIVSGFQPTGNFHVGNYLGAIKNLVDLQNSGKYEMYIFIADLHALTGNKKPEELREQIMKNAAEFISAGIDPKKTTLFVQSDIQEHAELAWIFNCVTPISELYRMTQFKDKSVRQEKNINTGLLTYPVLQAADILLYHGNTVPVGQDQVQHVELTRDVAKWFNNKFPSSSAGKSEFFEEPKALLTAVPKVMSLLEPEKKMSKSLGEGHVIELGDEPEIIEKKLKRAVTATEGGVKAPGVENLLLLLKNFADEKVYNEFVKVEKAGNIRYGDLKMELAKVISNYFADFRAKRKDLLANPKKLQAILTAGAKKAKPVAEKTMKEVRKMIGLK
ncbi:MAG TPA: tryptophan--tRNA ligase [Candidatus Magasanikbacteria bacterium]|nr:tryptophan--tRNA ligase [Candidatus Magasanikbacteria bacterium]